jgi:hypothetical protein
MNLVNIYKKVGVLLENMSIFIKKIDLISRITS